ncbi:MAG: winged helix-turn-helix transcriptional regulator [Solobacterium sp.]|nr:winged helix-turn-helix transcriptional regulator [Solobacterium sp.]MCH4074570.1 winged helix-turn-helix transcriptional regulator [Solobacterium sp.]MCI1408560.1 winged helix-turn-helix transcriptional regulator [Solobacterium sp.]
MEYSLTEPGQSLAPVVEAMRTWGRNYQEIHPLQSKSH